jgi:hypothetical protein
MLGVYPHDPPTSLFRFVGEDSEKLRPARVLHPLGGAGAGQPEDVQVFMNDGSIAVDQMPGRLVKSLRPLAILRCSLAGCPFSFRYR